MKVLFVLIAGLVLVGCTVQDQGVQPENGLDPDDVRSENIQNQRAAGEKNEPPTIAITEPDGGDVLTQDLVTIWWKATDPNGDTLTVSLEYQSSGRWVPLTENEANDRSYEWDISGLENGEYKIRATASDGREIGQSVKQFTIDKP